MIVVALTLVDAAAPCGDTPTRQEIQEAIINSKHMMILAARRWLLINSNPLNP
jgi:hypothetical protein